MQMKIKSLSLHNFKGCRDRKVEFEGNTKVFGANSVGKSTLFCAWMWLMAGVNEHLVSNPNITPLGESECESIVEAEITIDDTPCTITKTQKYKEKYDPVTEKTTASTVNSYAINGIEKSASAFATDMKQRGVDLDNFLTLSHVFAFTADMSKKGREEMRKVLFGMVKGISDIEIASEIIVPDVFTELKKGYQIDEVEQMAKQSLKKLNDTYGKSGEIIDAKISGMIESKSNVTLDGIAEQETEIKKNLKNVEDEINSLTNTDDREWKIQQRESAIKAIELKAREDYYLKRNEHLKAHSNLVDKFREVEAVINKANKSIYEANIIVENDNKVLVELRKSYETEFSKQYEADGKCPYCGQNLPKEMIENAEQQFNDQKTIKLNEIKAKADAINKELERQSAEIADAKETIERFAPDYESFKAQIEESSKWNLVEPNISDIPEAVALQAEINELRAKSVNTSSERLQALYDRQNSLKNNLREIDSRYKLFENDKEIDKRILELREQKKSVEIQRAEQEKLIYEVETFKKYKNNKLSDVINSFFEGVYFKLFKTLKNGSVEETVEVIVDGKEMNTQLNQASQVKARLAIIKGLSKFKDVYFPVFVDDASLMTTETMKSIDMPNQMIWLIAKDGYNELTIEKGE